jgi:hypothetical protein
MRQLDIGGHQMSLADDVKAPIRHADRFFIGGQWVQPSSDATIKVIDSGTEEVYFSVAEAQPTDISRAVEAARQAFDAGPWPRLTHAERAGYLRAIGAEISQRSEDLSQICPASAARAVARDCCPSWRPRPSSSKAGPPATRAPCCNGAVTVL